MVTYPKDWTEYSFKDFLKIKRGASPRPIEYYTTESASGVNWIKIGDAPKLGKYIVSTKERITESGAVQSVRVYPGDFLLSNSMSFGRPYILALEGCIHDGWLRLFDFQDTADDNYLYYLLSSDSVQSQYQSYAAGSGVQNLNKEVVKKVVVCLPSLPEQKSIAETLSCMDEHLANLTELIEKKKGIRDGALEGLVNGRTRLDGFNEKWKEHTFEDFMKIKRGASPRPIEYYITKSSSGVNWIKIGDAPKYGKNIIATKERITETGAFRSVRVYPGDFLLSNSMSFGRPYILNIEGCIHDGWLRLFNFQDTANAEYLYYLLLSGYVQRQYQCYAAGSGVQNLNKEVVKKVVVNLPSLPEQGTIAEILNSLDAEIAALEDEKDKMLQIKSGAMDDLLTGRIRLTRQGG